MSDGLYKLIRSGLSEAKSVLVVSHVRPDGDAVGSLLSLGLALEDTGKDVQMVLPNGLPGTYRHLSGSERVKSSAEGHFETIWVVDCSDLMRVDGVLDEYGKPDVNIDHHVTNINFANLNLVDTQAVSTTQILADLIPSIITPITKPIAEALLTGLITDTLGFRTVNMTPEALRLAADLMEMGCDLPDLYRRALIDRSFEATRLWGAGLNNIERDGRIVWTTISMQDRKSVGYPGRDDADLINVLSSIKSVDIALIFIEQPNGRVKVSWRSQPGVDVSQIAYQFGGGGHPAASGADVPGNLPDVQKEILAATRAVLDQRSRVLSEASTKI